jgi:F0F1-type ATP synthase assembly protein I
MSGKKKSSLKDILNKPLMSSSSDYVKYSGLGIQLVAVILVFLFIGIWIDGLLGTKFIFTLVFVFIGFFGGFYSFYLSIKKLNDEKKNNK